MSQTSSLSGGARFTQAVLKAMRESIAIVLAVLALVLLTALFTYSSADPGWSYSGEGGPVENRVGPLGAIVADLLYFLFGRPAFLLPVMLLVAAWLLMRNRAAALEPATRANAAVRAGGFLLLLAASCGLTALHWSPGELRETAGGVLGKAVGLGLSSGLKPLGATLLLLAAWMAGAALAFHVSWLAVMDAIGHGFWKALGWIKAWSSTRRDVADGQERKRERQEAVLKEKEKKEAAPRVIPVIEPPAPAVERSERAQAERQVTLFDPPKSGELPPMNLLDDPPARVAAHSPDALEAMSRLVEIKLKDFGVEVEVVAVHPGPVITRFEMQPAPGTKASQISGLSKDLARALSVVSVRVVEVIPGKPVVGLEIPNEKREMVTLGEIIKSKSYEEAASPLALALGKDIAGHAVVADLGKMPHLLIAGTTGSGKSVGINAMVLSLLYKSTAEHVRLIMIDPKMLELSVYEGIPHLLAPVVTDMKQAANALRWSVAEMDRRYALMSALGVRNIAGYNRKVRDANEA
ncbi:MAG TPA: DNA translocase FtsK 4TM domain-containing protein, partial [Steroidobacteraceae bacterium]|nr:DNA translocase FtsK 4TM domain-containing protein [Steroidobacteraceae bacterium]